jgi:uncharacterized membrane protein YqiK
MTKAQKAQVAESARQARLSMGEYMRHAALGDDPELSALLEQIQGAVRDMNAELDAAHAAVEAIQAEAAAREKQAREEAQATYRLEDVETFLTGAPLVTATAAKRSASAK